MSETAAIREAVGAKEWELRTELAACHRLVARYGMSELTKAVGAARLPRARQYLIKPYFHLFEEITASNLITVDFDGNVLQSGANALEKSWEYNSASHYFVTAIFAAREDVECVLHTHSVAGMAVSALKDGLLPLTQESLRFFGQIAFFEYGGVVASDLEGQHMAASLGAKRAMIMRNHGLLAAGRTVAEAFDIMFHLDNACRAQVAALSMGRELAIPDPGTCEQMGSRYGRNPMPAGTREWPALRRLLDREQPGYRE
jgi:ribulose-5-phosphate 4-epimerase/fuculose-1-phosphate aldolase